MGFQVAHFFQQVRQLTMTVPKALKQQVENLKSGTQRFATFATMNMVDFPFEQGRCQIFFSMNGTPQSK